MQKMWLAEKVTSLENETVELKKTIQEMEARIGQQEKEITEMTRRNGAIETAIARIVEQLQRQISFNEGVRASFTSLGEEVNKHQNNFREVARIFQAHEEHIIKTGAAYQQMAQCINSLVRESENNTVWISSVMRETQEQTQVLRQHEVGLQVRAEVLKRVMNQQPQQQQQTAARTGPTISEVDDDNGTDQNFPSGPSPHAGPPNNFVFGAIEPPQVPSNMDVTPMF